MPPRLAQGGFTHQISVAAGVLTVCVLSALARQAPLRDQPRPTFRTEANYIRVDVYATTADGTSIADLRREEFRLLEDRVQQTIDQFAPVVIRAGAVPTTRSDPRSPEESRQAATESRARVFVLFLDALHVDTNASKIIARPLINALRSFIGPDDLVAIVTPNMQARTITFTRQMAAVESALDRAWGARDRVDSADPIEQRYATCYPGVPRHPDQKVAPDLGIAQEMILRRREEQTFDALEELVTYLRDVREERKAVITVTNGWRLYGPNQTLSRVIETTVPSAATPGFDPRTGKLSTDPAVTGSSSACDSDRLRLAQLDHTLRFRQLLDRANRANVSFYPVDPRGVVVFDDDIVPVAGVGQNPTISPIEDNRRLGERHSSMRTMAESTDGVAVIDTGNFGPALRRMTNDLSAYYLLGYYSTGKLDGKFHGITVSVTRPGVQIRARRGYLAATTVSPTAAPESTISAAAVAETQALSAALATLSTIAREPVLYVQAAVGWPAARNPSVVAVLEIGRGAADWAKGGEADLLLIDPVGDTAGAGHATIASGAGSVRVTIVPRAMKPGGYELRVRAKAAGATAASSESVRLTVPASADGSGAIFFRRGPATANKELPTADLRFRRSDTLRIVVPVAASTTADGGRLLDRAGKTLAIPIMVSVVDEADGSRWLAAQAALAPLAPGDYVIEVSGSGGGAQKRTLTAFRVIP